MWMNVVVIKHRNVSRHVHILASWYIRDVWNMTRKQWSQCPWGGFSARGRNIEVPRNSVILIITNRMKSWALMQCRCIMLRRYIVHDRKSLTLNFSRRSVSLHKPCPVAAESPNQASRAVGVCGCAVIFPTASVMGLHCSFSRIHNIPADPAPGARDWLRD